MEKSDSPELQCKPDWSLVCSSQGCYCEYRPPWAPSSVQPMPCLPPLQIQCLGTVCACSTLSQTPPVMEPPPAGADCGLSAAVVATALYKALLACR
jgi:hypothetical protein